MAGFKDGLALVGVDKSVGYKTAEMLHFRAFGSELIFVVNGPDEWRFGGAIA